MGFALPCFLLMVVIGRNMWLADPAHDNHLTKHDWLRLMVAAVLGYYGASVLDFIGLEYISASLERIILFLYPTLTVILSAAIFKKPITRLAGFALLLSYGGMLIVMFTGDQTVLTSHNMLLGVVLVFVSALAYASYLLLAEPLIKSFGKWQTTGLVMSVAAAASLVHFMVHEPNMGAFLSELPAQSWWFGALLGIFATVLPASLVIYGIAHIGAANSAMISAGGPVITIILAYALLDEMLTLEQWLGALVSISGVLLITLKAKKK